MEKTIPININEIYNLLLPNFLISIGAKIGIRIIGTITTADIAAINDKLPRLS